jgi:hypothetical protein
VGDVEPVRGRSGPVAAGHPLARGEEALDGEQARLVTGLGGADYGSRRPGHVVIGLHA